MQDPVGKLPATVRGPGAPSARPSDGAWTALRHDIFRLFWAFSFVAFIGGSTHAVGASVLMVSIGGSPLQVSLVQGITNLSVVLAALPAGALADLHDRRVIMLAALVGMMAATGGVGFLALRELLTPAALLGITFLFGVSTAAMTPAMQSLLPELVPEDSIASAVTLNGISSSAARSVGPGVAGALIGLVGSGTTLMWNMLAFCGLWWVILRWRRNDSRHATGVTFRKVADSLVEGLRFARRNRPLRALLLETLACFVGVAAVLSLLPSLANERFGDGGTGAAHYLGGLLSCFGVGSVLGSLAVAPLARRFDRRRATWIGTLACGASMLVLVGSRHALGMGIAMFGAGASWSVALTCVNISAQMLLPREMLARGLSLSMMTLMFALAFGSAAWGVVATRYSVAAAITAAGLVAVAWPALRLVRAGVTPAT